MFDSDFFLKNFCKSQKSLGTVLCLFDFFVFVNFKIHIDMVSPVVENNHDVKKERQASSSEKEEAQSVSVSERKKERPRSPRRERSRSRERKSHKGRHRSRSRER